MSFKKLFVTVLTAATLTVTPATANAKTNIPSVRYSSGIVTGSKSMTTQDGNIWGTKRKIKLRKGTKVRIKFSTMGTRTKLDDHILKITIKKGASHDGKGN